MSTSGALQWLLVDGNGWIPHREDIYTWYHLRHLPTKDLQGFVWLDSFVKRLCEDCGLDNPFEDTRNSNDTDENVDGTDFISLPSEFLRRVRFVCNHLEFLLCHTNYFRYVLENEPLTITTRHIIYTI
jgi:hypothetical protein